MFEEMKPRLFDTLQSIDEFIRLGHLPEARRALKALSPSKIPRDNLATFANLLRRTGLIEKGLRLLNDIVRSDSNLIVATPEEKIEYAMLLVRVGAIHEARDLLASVSSDSYPEVLLYQTFTMTPEWRYAETIPLLEKYIQRVTDRPNQILIAKVNLIAAQIFCRKNDGLQELFQDAISSAQKYRYNFLLGSLYELAAQFEIARERYDRAEQNLDKAQSILGATNSQESFYVVKWRTLIRILQDSKKPEAESEIAVLRKKALLLNDFETVRDCDFHLLRFKESQSLFDYLFCGSPSASYRKRLTETFPQYKTPTASYNWQLSGQPTTSRRFLFVKTAQTGDGKSFTELGQAPHKLLLLLTRDFYRPQRLIQLATEIFEGEYTHPIYTPSKMHQILARLRADLKKAKIPLRIISKDQTLRLVGIRNCTIIKDWTFDSARIDSVSLYMTQLEGLGSNQFTAKEAARLWDCSVSTASRRLTQACEALRCRQLGHGRFTRFQLLQIETTT